MKQAVYFLPTVLSSLIIGMPLSGCVDSDREVSSAESAQAMLRRVVRHDGIEREYFVHVPDGAGENPPLVVAVHGYTSTATGFRASHGINRHADEHGYIVVYPQGSHFKAEGPNDESFLVTSWNDLASNMPPTPEGPHCTDDSWRYPCPAECGECNRCAWTSCYDDVGFLEKLLDSVQSEFAIDKSRTYLLGVSNGGMMTLRLGCNLSDRFAAIAPIIAQLAPGYACGPDVDLPMMHLFGGEDDTVRFDGKPAGDGFIYTTAAKTAEVWASALACESGPQGWHNDIAAEAELVCTAYSDCRVEGQEVVSCMDPDGTHAWPEQYVGDMPATCITSEQYESLPDQQHCATDGGDYVSLGMDLIWEFFKRYPLTLGR